MKLFLPLVATLVTLAAAAPAQEGATSASETTMELASPVPFIDARDVALEDYLWTARPVVVFADTPADPRFKEQVELLQARASELAARDVVVITDADPAAQSAVRLKLRPRGFMMVLIGKDGGVKLRKPSPWSVREIGRSIDKMPMRQQEIREQNAAGG